MTRKIHDPRWRKRPPRQIDERFQQFPLVLIYYTTVPRHETWCYIKFLFEELVEPRSRLESQLKDRYKHCYEQSKHLGLSTEQLIGCGGQKQVLTLGNTVPLRVIKLFDKPEEWLREKRTYDRLDCVKYHLLPHVYYEHYAICDRVEVCTEDSIQQALDQGKIHNTKFAKRILKFRRRNQFNFGNLGFYQDMLVWIDIGDCEWVLAG